MAKIGILGGTFDPIHNGHLMLGRQAYEEWDLDEIWFMPSGDPPHKRDHIVTAAVHRCAMIQLALTPYPHFILSDFEVKRQGTTYTAETMSLLHKAYPRHQFYFIIGADSLYELERWYHPERVLRQAVILVAGREYEDAPRSLKDQIAYLSRTYQADIRPLHFREMDISSNELRDLESRGKTLRGYVPKSVEAYIEAHGLYQEGDLHG